jgi:hypothetical protein
MSQAVACDRCRALFHRSQVIETTGTDWHHCWPPVGEDIITSLHADVSDGSSCSVLLTYQLPGYWEHLCSSCAVDVRTAIRAAISKRFAPQVTS